MCGCKVVWVTSSCENVKFTLAFKSIILAFQDKGNPAFRTPRHDVAYFPLTTQKLEKWIPSHPHEFPLYSDSTVCLSRGGSKCTAKATGERKCPALNPSSHGTFMLCLVSLGGLGHLSWDSLYLPKEKYCSVSS